MKTIELLKTAGFTAAVLCAATAASAAPPVFTPLQGGGQGVLYTPDGPTPHIVVLQSHRVGNNLNSGTCREFVARGFAAFCFNTRYVNNEAGTRWDNVGLDVKAAVEYVRKVPGITKVIAFNHSGGSPMFSYYEAVAENGMSYCNGKEKIWPCPANYVKPESPWVPLDGMVYQDAHPGNGPNLDHDINPSVTLVNGKITVDPSIDPFNPANGYNPNGESNYSKEFRDKYYAAQARVANAYIKDAQEKMALIKAGKYQYPDDDIVIIPASDQAGEALLSMMQPSIPELMWTKRPEKLLQNDGTIVTQIVKSVAAPEPEIARVNKNFNGSARVYTLQSLLSANATWATSSQNIDYCSSNASTSCAVKFIHVPSLIMAMGAWHFVVDQEEMYDNSPAKDKEFLVIEGAVHGGGPCKECEKITGKSYSNSTKNLYDYAAKWINARF